MNIVGIIAEYNPFHNGHLHHLKETRRRTGCDAVVVVMSGDFVQRGVPGVMDKYARAESALRCGADLVLELPMYGATASAEDFSLAGVKALASLGCVTTLSYGAEDPDAPFRGIASYLLSDNPESHEALLAHVREGNSFAKARAMTIASERPDYAGFLQKPNNILAVEYESAILRTSCGFTTVAVPRSDRGYHDTEVTTVCSASAIRECVCGGNDFPFDSVPAITRDLVAGLNDSTAVSADDFSDMLFSELSAHTPESLSALYDIPADLAKRILNRAVRPFTWTSLAEDVKCKAFTRSRIDRALCHALLRISAEDAAMFKAGDSIPYLRVLGMREEARALLSEIDRTGRTVLLRRLADDTRSLSADAKHLLEGDLRASSLYSQILYKKTGVERSDTRRKLTVVS